MKRAKRLGFAVIITASLLILILLLLVDPVANITTVSLEEATENKQWSNWSYKSESCYPQDEGIYDKNHNKNNLEYWKSLSTDDISKYQSSWKNFVSEIPTRVGGNSRGVVYTTFSKFLRFTIASIKLLRKSGCVLPIEVWYFDDELTESEIQSLESIGNVTVKDLLKAEIHRFSIKRPAGEKFFAMKGAAILYSSFDQVLFLDSDVFCIE